MRLDNLQFARPWQYPGDGCGTKELAPLKELHTLDLGSTKVTDAGMKELAGLKEAYDRSYLGHTK